VALRLDPRLAPRIDPADVVQEVLLEATMRLSEFQTQTILSPFLWLRLMTLQRVAILHRQHLRVQARDARREVNLGRCGGLPDATSVALAEFLVGRHTSPSQAASRAELRQRVQDALETMAPLDREVLTLRHFEQLSNKEAALVLELEPAAASKRYLRALVRMKEILATVGIVAED
jgi:RNA polymerase sigma-70 factor (ECF subfamily)